MSTQEEHFGDSEQGDMFDRSRVETALLSAQSSMSEIVAFLSAKEDAETDPSDRGRDINSFTAADVITAILGYIRSTVATALTGTIAMPTGPKPQQPAKLVDETAHLRVLVTMLSQQLEAERREKRSLLGTMQRFNNVVGEYRLENNVVQTYKNRIAELQLILNKAGVTPPDPPAAMVAEQRQREAANELARLTTAMKERLDKVAAENHKLSADKVALLADKGVLLERVRVLEAQLAVLAASSSASMRELQRERLHKAQQMARPDKQHAPLSAGECVVGGVVMEKDVVLWLKEMYNTLMHGDETKRQALPPPPESKTYEKLKRRPSSTASSSGSRTGSQQHASSFADHVAKVRSSSELQL